MSIEKYSSVEKQEKEPRAIIKLELFRHDDKEQRTLEQSDEKIRLTPKGREHASEVGQEKDFDIETSLAYGSPRERSIESADRQMLANQDEITPEMSLEDIREKIDKHLKVGKKEMIDERLGFNFSRTEEFRNTVRHHYLEEKDFLRFLVEESDDLIVKLKDKSSDSYSRAAGKIGELVKKYVDILPQWEKIIANNPNKYSQYNNQMTRFLGSHAGYIENFLMKVIEKTSGKEALLEFINNREDKNTFGFSEGYNIEIVNGGNQANIKVSYGDQEWSLSPETLEEIIEDRRGLDKKIEE